MDHGPQVVPPVDSIGWGFVRFFFSQDRLSADYTVDVKGFSGNIVLGADIRRSAPGTNGPIIHHLADGGFGSAQDIESAHGEVVEVYCPPTQSKHGTDPYLARRGDGDGVLAWRARMASEPGKAQYKSRSICECIHARWRNWDLRQLTVRSIAKVRAVVLYYALANNILQGHRLATA